MPCAASESDSVTPRAGSLGPHAKEATPPGYLSRAPPLEFATRAAAFTYSCAAANPSRRRRRILAVAAVPSTGSNPGAAQGGDQATRVTCCRPRAPYRP
jgi:hypothetical protein